MTVRAADQELSRRVREALQKFAHIDTPTAVDWIAAELAVRKILKEADFAHSLLPAGKRRLHVEVEEITGWPGFLTIRETDQAAPGTYTRFVLSSRQIAFTSSSLFDGDRDLCSECFAETATWVDGVVRFPICFGCLSTAHAAAVASRR